MKKFWKSVKIWRCYHHEYGGTLFLEHGDVDALLYDMTCA